MDIIKALFITYWSQTLLLMGIIGYFGKNYFDLISKKVEVKFSLFHNQKLSAINNFLIAYTALESFYWQVPYHDVLERKIKPKELDEMILPRYNSFINSYYSLFLVLNDKELKEFESIKEEIENVKTTLGDLYDVDPDEKKITYKNNYYISYKNMMKKNEQTLKSIGIHFRDSFNKN